MKNNKTYLNSNDKEKGEYIMATASVKPAHVKTVSDAWVNNVIKGFFENPKIIIDYWTNNWLPTKNIDILKVYHQGKLLFIGDVQGCYKKDHKNVYKNFSSNLFSIGLVPGNSLIDFEYILKNAFSGYWDPEDPKDLGNIEFRIIAITPEFIRLLEKLEDDSNTLLIPEDFKLPQNVEILGRDYSMPKKLEGRTRIVYE